MQISLLAVSLVLVAVMVDAEGEAQSVECLNAQQNFRSECLGQKTSHGLSPTCLGHLKGVYTTCHDKIYSELGPLFSTMHPLDPQGFALDAAGETHPHWLFTAYPAICAGLPLHDSFMHLSVKLGSSMTDDHVEGQCADSASVPCSQFRV